MFENAASEAAHEAPYCAAPESGSPEDAGAALLLAGAAGAAAGAAEPAAPVPSGSGCPAG